MKKTLIRIENLIQVDYHLEIDKFLRLVMELSDTKKQLIEAAILLFSQNDVSKLSVQKINDLAGVSNKSALYYHFKSKWGLFEAALHYVLNPYVTNCLHELDKISTALLHKDLKCKAPLIEPNLRRNLGKWST